MALNVQVQAILDLLPGLDSQSTNVIKSQDHDTIFAFVFKPIDYLLKVTIFGLQHLLLLLDVKLPILRALLLNLVIERQSLHTERFRSNLKSFLTLLKIFAMLLREELFGERVQGVVEVIVGKFVVQGNGERANEFTELPIDLILDARV